MNDPIARYAQTRPDAPALLSADDEWTYARLHEDIRILHGALRQAGVRSGVRVGLHRPRTAETVLWLWAIWRLGAVAVPLSPRLPPAEVGAEARRVGVSLLLSGDEAVHAAAPDKVEVRSPAAIRSEQHGAVSPSPQSRERPATILFTSGSTGRPKAVLHSWANHLYSAKGANANIPLGRGDRWLLSLPLYHVGGLAILVRCAIAGAVVVVPGEESLADAVRARQATHASLVPTQLRRLIAAEKTPPSCVRAILLGGGPLPTGLVRRAYAAGWPLHTTYGCTEMASQVTTTAPGAPRESLRTAGRRLPHRRIRIRDGEIQVAGPPLCRGYVADGDLVDPRTDDGWYPTGDAGEIDAGGRLRVLGRMDRMFVSGGENIHPEEIETVLERVAGVERAAVVPVPDREYGQRPVAFVAGSERPPAEVLETALREWLPGFKIPDAFHSLPTSMGEEEHTIDRDHLQNRARDLQKQESPDGP